MFRILFFFGFVFGSAYGSEKEVKKGIFDEIPHIEHLTPENFDKRVLQSDRAWVVVFYNAKNEKSHKSVPEITKLAKILAGIAKIGVINAAEHEKLAHNYDAKDTPTIILFGNDKTKPTLYKDKIEAAQLIKKVGAQVKNMVRAREDREPNPKKDVVKLTADNFDKKVLQSDGIWFVKYYDPNCAHSKAFAPEYAKAAASLKGAVHVGAVNMDVEIYDKMGAPYDIEKVPWVKIFGVDKKHPADFMGQRKAVDLIDRAFEEMEKLVKFRLTGKTELNEGEIYGGEEEEEEDEKAGKKIEQDDQHSDVGKREQKEGEKTDDFFDKPEAEGPEKLKKKLKEEHKEEEEEAEDDEEEDGLAHGPKEGKKAPRKVEKEEKSDKKEKKQKDDKKEQKEKPKKKKEKKQKSEENFNTKDEL